MGVYTPPLEKGVDVDAGEAQGHGGDGGIYTPFGKGGRRGRGRSPRARRGDFYITRDFPPALIRAVDHHHHHHLAHTDYYRSWYGPAPAPARKH